jgi:hypothetical protein
VQVSATYRKLGIQVKMCNQIGVILCKYLLCNWPMFAFHDVSGTRTAREKIEIGYAGL